MSRALHRLVLPIDHQPATQPAVQAATALLTGLACREAGLTLVHVGEEGAGPAVSTPHRDGWSWEMLTCRGEPVEEILRTAMERGADLIVMTTQGHHGFLDALRGSTPERVLRRAPCPVLAVPAGSTAMSRLFFNQEAPS
jgi:Universal stress protein family